MRTFLYAVLACSVLCGPVLAAEEEGLIPANLNAVLPKIVPRATTKEVETILAPVYPGVTSHLSIWSGDTGYIDYKLDDRFTLSVSSISMGGRNVVHDSLLFYILDWPAQQRFEIRRYHWAATAQTSAAPAAAELPRPTGEPYQRGAPPVTEGFGDALEAARHGGVKSLQMLLSRFIQPREQFMIEREISRACASSEVRDDRGGVEHFTKALAYEPEGSDLVQLLGERAGAYERLGEVLPELYDCLRILLRCSYYDLSGEYSPRLRTSNFPRASAKRAAELPRIMRQDQEEHRASLSLEDALRVHRHSAIEQIKRLRTKQKLADETILQALAELSPDRRKDKTIMQWLDGENPDPYQEMFRELENKAAPPKEPR